MRLTIPMLDRADLCKRLKAEEFLSPAERLQFIETGDIIQRVYPLPDEVRDSFARRLNGASS